AHRPLLSGGCSEVLEPRGCRERAAYSPSDSTSTNCGTTLGGDDWKAKKHHTRTTCPTRTSVGPPEGSATWQGGQWRPPEFSAPTVVAMLSTLLSGAIGSATPSTRKRTPPPLVVGRAARLHPAVETARALGRGQLRRGLRCLAGRRGGLVNTPGAGSGTGSP